MPRSDADSELSDLRAEVILLRNKLSQLEANSSNLEAVVESSPTTRRRLLRKIGISAASVGLLALGVSGADSSTATAQNTTPRSGLAGNGGPNGYGAKFSGGIAPLYLVPSANPNAGAPSAGTHAKGEFYVDNSGALFYCIGDGTPGNWRKLDEPNYRTNSGTSFPSTPTNGDRFFRTDRGIEYYWDGLYWLSVSPLYHCMSYYAGLSRPIVATTYDYQLMSRPDEQYSIYIEKIVIATNVLTTFNAYNYWQLQLYKSDLSGVRANVGGPLSIYQAGRVPDFEYLNMCLINSAYGSNELFNMGIDWFKVGNPGPLYDVPASVKFRLIG